MVGQSYSCIWDFIILLVLSFLNFRFFLLAFFAQQPHLHCTAATLTLLCSHAYSSHTPHLYRGHLSVVDVPRLQTESGQIDPTSPFAPSHSAWSSTPWGLLQCPREPSNLLPLMGSGHAWPDRPRQNNSNNIAQ